MNITSDGSLRRAIGPLKDIAADTGAAIVLLRHLNAQRNAPAYRRGLGGAALANIARSVLVMALHPDDTGAPSGRRILAYVKGNLDGRITTSVEVALDDAGRIVIGPEVAITSDELLRHRPTSGVRRPSVAEAGEWLRAYLNGREVPTTEVEDAAAERDISQRTLERARADIGVLHRRLSVRNADGSTTHQTVLRLPGFVIVETAEASPPPASLPPPAPPPLAPRTSLTTPNTTASDDASIRFSQMELDDGPSGAASGGLGGVGNPAPINGNPASAPTPPTPPSGPGDGL